ncbi:hypothetical protein M9Y10_004617 [Tritrichomonas musculus]|uniref:Sulfatase N-terminal domain-containing protein n=1 Tax=Tritrichomonas musculus TaxID=1915356 RepID=A0ABR2JJC0_9EUKA
MQKSYCFSISLLDFALLEGVLFLCEFIQLLNGEKQFNFFFHLLFFSINNVFISIFKQYSSDTSTQFKNNLLKFSFPKFFNFFIIVYHFVETGSYVFSKHDIDFQVLSSFSLGYVFKQHIDFLFYFLILFFFILFIISIQTNRIIYQFLFSFLLILSIFDIVLFFPFFIIAYRSLYPFNDVRFHDYPLLVQYSKYPATTTLRSDYSEIFESPNVRSHSKSLINIHNKNKLRTKPPTPFNLTSPHLRPKRNLIIIQMESLELQSLGAFNSRVRTMMPFLSNFSQRGTFMENVEPQPFTLWTAGSIFSTHCGLPHVISDQIWRAMSTKYISKWPKLPCLPHHFLNVGYNLYFSTAGDMSLMGITDFFKQSGFETEDASVHHFIHDYDFYNYATQRLFKVKIDSTQNVDHLIKRFTVKEPFLYIFNNEDTHPFFYVDKRCKPNKKAGNLENSVNCLDKLLKIFFEAFEKSDFFERTDVLMYGDHPAYGNQNKYYRDPRKMLMFFPYLEKRRIKKKVTLYDVAPTILDMMGMEYFPPYPYGANMFDDEVVGNFPKNDEFNFIYAKILDKSNQNLKCFQKGICGDNWQYYRTRV